MPVFTEKSTVEDYIIQKLRDKGWRYVPGEELEREDYSEPLLIKDFVRAIKRINADLELSEGDINRILAELKGRPASFEGSKHILRFLKQGLPIKLERTRELKYVDLIDQKNPENNEFIVSNQVPCRGPRETIRPDIILYVNGIPLVLIECKHPAAPGVSWEDAYRQVKDYENIAPELFKYVQFSIAAEATARYFPNVMGLEEVNTYLWRKEGVEDDLEATLEMLSKPTLIDIVVNFTFAREERGKSSKVLPRFMQYEAANRIYERVIANLEGKESKNSGLIWHWQGSGKTLVMIFATYKLYRDPRLGNPTIFLVVDRDELEKQLRDEFSCLDLEIPKPEVISSVEALREVLTYDGCRGKRGIFITLVHKFREDLSALGLEKRSEEAISGRKNVIAIIDEGHRTQYGKLAGQMRNVLRSAFFFAFTGTPLAKGARDTYRVFSYPSEGEKYLHKYFIHDSMKDGFTIPVVFQTRMEKEVGLDRKHLEYFLSQALEEIPEEIRGPVERRISRRLNDIVVFLKNPGRIEKIARDIAEHFRENVDGKFKGMVVAACREACVTYKEKLDRLLPPEYAEIVMTFNPHTDPEPIRRYYEDLRQRYQGRQIEEIREEIRRKFKEEEHPKILIVTDMLLTGFDAPVLQVMYLDKPLKEHRLLQAIARTNRPFGEVKEAGLIIDYVGILREFEKAIAIYEKQDIKYAAIRVEEKVREFRGLLQRTEDLFGGLHRESADRETLMRANKMLFHSDAMKREFIKNYRCLRRIYEFLGPMYFDQKDLKRLKWLTAIYNYYREHEERKEPEEVDNYFRKYFRRTVETIHKTLDVRMKEEFPVLKLDEKYLERLREAYPREEDRVYDLVFVLTKYVLVDRSKKLLYEPIAGKVERIVRNWRERKIGVKEAYERLSELARETLDLERRQRELGLSEPEYLMLVMLEEKLGRSKKLTEEIRSLWEGLSKSGLLFEGWNKKTAALKDVGREIRRFLRKKLPLKERDEVYEKIIRGLRAL
ncbi:MAG: HsdR family type I site-specific deoxyribonuclease [Candidatus Hadarchaeales archaeon]